ncbi:MAG: hypothetical protein WBL19_00525, partial [Minisyncoccia bacterium]
MKIVESRKIFFTLSAILIGLSLASFFAFGFNFGIDFKGGTLTEVRFEGERPDKTSLEEKISTLGLGGFSLRPSGEANYVVRTKELSREEAGALLEVMGNPTLERQNTVGPVAGAELRGKAFQAVSVATILIVLFITFAFRKVSHSTLPKVEGTRVPSWKYGLATIVALLHDIVIPVGIFISLGHFYGHEIDLLFVSGILAILGYSVHDTIVVFDRVRENLRLNDEAKTIEPFETTVGRSVKQTLVRSINTS